MPKLPNVTPEKELPNENLEAKEVPKETKLNVMQVENTPKLNILPTESKKVDYVPDASPKLEETPSELNEENCVIVGDKKIEIKPTKLKYFRNKAASAYGVIRDVPLYQILTCEKGVLDARRSGDELLYDFLISVFDNVSFVRDHYDEIDADTIERIVKIIGRLNHIEEKEEARKNREAQVKR